MTPRKFLAWVFSVAIASIVCLGVVLVFFDVYRGTFPRLTSLTSIESPLGQALLIAAIAAIPATVIVVLLQATRGDLEFSVLGMKFKGPSGPITLWALVFLVVAGVILGALSATKDNTKNSESDKRSVVEAQIKKIIDQNKTAADTICTIVGSVDATDDWGEFQHWINSTAMLYVEPESAERMILSSSFLDTVSKTTSNTSRAALDGINSNTKLYLAESKNELKEMLKKLDRQYQYLSEVLLYEIGEAKVPTGTALKIKLLTVSRDSRNSWYCNETKYQKSTQQNLGR